MTVDQVPIPCTASAVRAWLLESDPVGVATFDQQFHVALDQAGRSYDLTAVEAVVRSWWALVWGRTQQLSDAERALLSRVDDGDLRGLSVQDEDGSFRRLG